MVSQKELQLFLFCVFKRESYNYCRQQEESVTSASTGNSAAAELGCLMVPGNFTVVSECAEQSQGQTSSGDAVAAIREISHLTH